MHSRYLTAIVLFLVGCADASTVCASKLHIPQDDQNVYLSQVKDPAIRSAFYECVIRRK